MPDSVSPDPLPRPRALDDLSPAASDLLRRLLTLPAAEVERIRRAALPRRRAPGQEGPSINLGED